MRKRMEIIKAAISYFGETHQKGKVVEELSELSVEVAKVITRARIDVHARKKILEEIADVRIMTDQLFEILSIQSEIPVSVLRQLEGSVEQEKLIRLDRMMGGE
jgi:hypothetical protein